MYGAWTSSLQLKKNRPTLGRKEYSERESWFRAKPSSMDGAVLSRSNLNWYDLWIGKCLTSDDLHDRRDHYKQRGSLNNHPLCPINHSINNEYIISSYLVQILFAPTLGIQSIRHRSVRPSAENEQRPGDKRLMSCSIVPCSFSGMRPVYAVQNINLLYYLYNEQTQCMQLL